MVGRVDSSGFSLVPSRLESAEKQISRFFSREHAQEACNDASRTPDTRDAFQYL